MPVAVSSVKEQAIFRQIKRTSSVTSPSVAKLSPAIAGLVDKLHVDTGDYVNAGDLLLELDAEVAEDRVAFELVATENLRMDFAVADPGVRTFLLRVVATESSPPLIPGMSVHATLRVRIVFEY